MKTHGHKKWLFTVFIISHFFHSQVGHFTITVGIIGYISPFVSGTSSTGALAAVFAIPFFCFFYYFP